MQHPNDNDEAIISIAEHKRRAQQQLERAAKLYFALLTDTVLEQERRAKLMFIEQAAQEALDASFLRDVFVLPTRRDT